MRITAISAACLVLVGISMASDVEAAIRRTTTIQAQGLAPALETLAKEREFQILYVTSVVEGRRTGGASGDLTADEALKQLLAGTGLEFRYVDDRTVTIFVPGRNTKQPSPTARAMSLRKGESNRGAGPSRLSLSDGEKPSPATVAQNEQGKAESSSSPAEVKAEREAIPTQGLPEILVTGSRSLNTDIRRTEDSIQPYVVFNGEEIRRSQAANAEDFLKTRLPMNTQQVVNEQDPFFSAGQPNEGRINLRGLGTNQTLILIDGRRVPGVSGQLDIGQPNITGIPLVAIERIEVLPSTAGGIYGGGATGGVVNIVMKRNYSGVDLHALYGDTFESDTSTFKLEGSAGFSLEDGRMQVMLTLSHAESNPLLVQERQFAARGRALQLRNNPAAITGGSSPPLGLTPNICGATVFPEFGFGFCDGSVLVLDDNTPLGDSIAAVPVGYAGPAGDNGVAFVDTAGGYNLDLPRSGETILLESTIDSASLNLRRAFGDRIEAYVDLHGYRNRGQATRGVALGSVILLADAPNNPFQQDVIATMPIPNLFNPYRTKVEMLQGSGGIIARLPHEWTAALEHARGRTESLSSFTSPPVDADGEDFAATGATQDTNAFPIDFTPYLQPSPNNIAGPHDTTLDDTSLRVAGPILRLPAGPLTLTGLIAHRNEEASDAIAETPGFPTLEPVFLLYPHKSQKVDSAYLEARTPFVSATNARAFVRELELQASIRRDEYVTVSTPDTPVAISKDGPFEPANYSRNTADSTDYTFGLRYVPIAGVALRASFGTGFLPPSLSQISSSETVFNFGPFPGLTPTDPMRGDTFLNIPYTVIGGGNPNLSPEESRSWSAGVILAPSFLPGLRFSVDYTEIEKSNEVVGGLSPQFVVDNETQFPGRVARDPDPATWGAFGVGPILTIDTTLLNAATTDVEAYDFQIDYVIDTATSGTFRPYVVATNAKSFSRRTLSDGPKFDSVGFSDAGAPLEWRANFGLTWDRGAWTFGWHGQYFDSYSITLANPDFAAGNPDLVLNQGNSGQIPSQIYHDLFARYRFDSDVGIWSGIDISLGIQNVANENPPVIATTFGETNGGYSLYGDPRLRRYTLSLRKNFGGK